MSQHVVFGQRHGGAEGLAAGNNGHFMERIGVLEQDADQRMAGFVPGGAFLVLFGHGHAAALAAHADFDAGFLQFGRADGFLVHAARPAARLH